MMYLMGIAGLGHAGLWVNDLVLMRDFYRDILGLTVTDEDLDIGMVFFSAQPAVEHHELVLARGRPEGNPTTLNQLSWRLEDLATLQSFHQRFIEERVRIKQVVTHGIALGIYFLDPEDNVNEVYWVTGRTTPQPFRRDIDLAQTPGAVLDEAERLLTTPGSTYRRA
jgi:catechol-2,3-dioxygenase